MPHKHKIALLLTSLLACLSLSTFASAQGEINENEPVLTRKPCEELKAEIAAKIQANGVETYTLGIVPNEELKDDDKVVGSCDGGTKKITYKRG